MDIRTLRYFIEVVRQQSFTRAAEVLCVTQPTISKMLRHLEEELECQLLVREGRRLHLTESGQAVYQRGLTIVEEFRQLGTELTDISAVKKGVLRLGIPPMVGSQMAALIGHFRQTYPGIELQISEFGGLVVQQAVESGELDLAVVMYSPPHNPTLTFLPLLSHPLCVVVPRTAEWLSCQQLSIQQLAEYPLLTYNEDFALYKQLMQAFSDHQLTPNVAVRSGQWDFLANMVQAGIGLAVLPLPICQRLDKEALMWLPLTPVMHWHLGLTWRQDHYLSLSAQAWIAACRERWPQPPAIPPR